MSAVKNYIADRPCVLEAIDYAERGWAVLPIRAGDKVPHFPFAPRAYLSATRDLDTITAWFDKVPNLNLGIAAIQSGLVVVDIDHRTLDTRGEALLERLPDTYKVRTGDGFHCYYLDPRGVPFPGKLANGVEIKHRGYVVAAPSIHPNGSTYTVLDDRDPAAFPLDLLGKAARR